MAPVTVNNNFEWKNLDRRQTVLGFGIAYEDVDDDTDRDTQTNRDTFEQNLKPEDYKKAQKLFGTYYNMFVGGITASHRAFVRAKARAFSDWADGVDDRFWRESNRLDAKSKRDMKRQMCLLEDQMNTVGGTTRSCFVGRLKGDLAKDMLVDLNAQKLANYQTMEQTQGEAIARANQALYNAYVEADSQDYSKLLSTLQLMKGSWTTNVVDDHVVDTIERDISTKRFTADWERMAESVSETAGEYDGDYQDILAAGAAVIAANPLPTPTP